MENSLVTIISYFQSLWWNSKGLLVWQFSVTSWAQTGEWWGQHFHQIPWLLLGICTGVCCWQRLKLLRYQQQPQQVHEVSPTIALDLVETVETNQPNALPSASPIPEPDCWQQLHQQSAVVELSKLGLAESNLDLILKRATELVAQVLQVEYCGLYEVLSNQTTAYLQAGVGWSTGLVGMARVSISPQTEVGYALRQDNPVTIADLRLETRFGGSPLLHNHKVASGVIVTLETEERKFGLLGAYTRELRCFTPQELEFVGAIAQVLSATVKRREAEERLYLLQRAINASSNGVIITDALATDNPVIYVNRHFERITGYTSEEVKGTNCRFLQGHDQQQPGIQQMRKAIAEGQPCHEVLRNYRKDGSSFWNEVRIAPVYNPEGHLTHYIGIQTNITDRIHAEAQLRKSEEQFRLTFDLAPIGMAIANLQGQLLRVNQALCEALGYNPTELLALTGVDITHPDDWQQEDERMQALIRGDIEQFQLEKRYLAKNKQVVHTILQVGLVHDSEDQPLHIIQQIIDISDRKKVEAQLYHKATHDALTGLPNRAYFESQLQQVLKKTQRNPNHRFAVLFLDLDRFKVINDSLGHLVGDELLVAIAHKLTTCLRETDTIARLGGDEFTALLDDFAHPHDALNLAQRILDELSRPFNLQGYEVFTKASIGIVFGSPDYTRTEDLLRDADLAMYRAKELGKGRYEIYDKTMHKSAVVRLQLENDLQRALLNQEFRLHYQPILNLATGETTGFEALIRWQHPTQGFISPLDFIEVAQETRLIIPIGEWILHQACTQLRKWQTQFNHPHLKIHINLTAEQIQSPHLVEKIDTILQKTGLDPACLHLEITENVILDHTPATNEVLQQLRQRQIKLCIDDFGTGYSSLSYLHRFPMDILKIDRSFINCLEEDTQRAEIVQTIITLAHTLQMQVVAEGIETNPQYHHLQGLDCEEGQGYLFARPLSPLAVEEYLGKQ